MLNKVISLATEQFLKEVKHLYKEDNNKTYHNIGHLHKMLSIALEKHEIINSLMLGIRDGSCWEGCKKHLEEYFSRTWRRENDFQSV